MNADARHGGMRPKRCLPAQFHPITAHYRLMLKRSERLNLYALIRLKYPQVTATIVTALKTANSRFFTDCYPISAAFAPGVDQIPASATTISISPPHYETHNSSFNISYLAINSEPRAGKKTKVPAAATGTFFIVMTVTNLRWPAGAGRPGYQDGRRPVVLLQQVPGGRERQVPAAPAGEHTLIPAR